MEKLKQVSINEMLAMCRFRLSRGKQNFTLYLPPFQIPPIRPFRKTEVRDEIAGVVYQVYVKPSGVDGGWIIKVRATETPINNLGEALKKAIK
jgi:hypothetical protein